ncbi:MAG: hypothetical protein Q7R83_02355 [bacterium]|nr:hypothetical protein [bacterium]
MKPIQTNKPARKRRVGLGLLLGGSLGLLALAIFFVWVQNKTKEAARRFEPTPTPIVQAPPVKAPVKAPDFTLKALPKGADDIDPNAYWYAKAPNGTTRLCSIKNTSECFVCPPDRDARAYVNDRTFNINLADPKQPQKTRCDRIKG